MWAWLEKLKKTVSDVASGFNAAKDKVTGTFSGAIDWTKNKVSDATDWTQNKLFKLANGAKDKLFNAVGYKPDPDGSIEFGKLLHDAKEAKEDISRALLVMTQETTQNETERLLIGKLCLLLSRLVYLQTAAWNNSFGLAKVHASNIPGDYGAAIATIADLFGLTYFPATGAKLDSDRDFPYAGVFIRKKPQPVIIFAFRGSANAAEFTRDAKFSVQHSVQHWSSGLHLGFLTGLYPTDKGSDGRLKYNVMPWFRNILRGFEKKYPGIPVYFTGHSLGGAYATLLGADVLLNPTVPEVPKIPAVPDPHGQIINFKGLYTFGSPRVGTKDFARQFEYARLNYPYGAKSRPEVLRFVNGKDIVTMQPPVGYKHVGAEIPLGDRPMWKLFSVTDHSGASYWEAINNKIAKK
ncbi:Alpha/Beta hydrolase protein [Mycena galericulata]|nr:Alpha/Beta hydrolase protein [Mycena galericulata]